MRESKIEAYLVDRVKALGGLAWKFVSPGLIGPPDRFVALPGAQMFFVEVKQLGEKPDPWQERRHAELRAVGATVWVVDSIEAVDEVLARYA